MASVASVRLDVCNTAHDVKSGHDGVSAATKIAREAKNGICLVANGKATPTSAATPADVNVNDLLLALQRIAMVSKEDMSRGAECAYEMRTIARAAVVAAIGESNARKCYLGLFGIMKCTSCTPYVD